MGFIEKRRKRKFSGSDAANPQLKVGTPEFFCSPERRAEKYPGPPAWKLKAFVGQKLCCISRRPRIFSSSLRSEKNSRVPTFWWREKAKKLLLTIFIFHFSFFISKAQTLPATDSLDCSRSDTTQLRHQPTNPFSGRLYYDGQVVSASFFELLPKTNRLILNEPLGPGPCVFRYRYFSQNPDTALQLLRPPPEDTSGEEPIPVVIIPPENNTAGREDDILADSRLRRSGAISRAITVGNRQGLAVNSGLRLQLEGDLGGGLSVVGSITDENIPIQPSGTTQQLSDFDRVFLQLRKGNGALTVGDFEESQKNTRFANFYRNVQGAQIKIKEKDWQGSASASLAKGRFHTNSIQGIEGVSGPYRLTGRNGERFFIILAGSEAVYLNGKKMVRGETNDYVINYNTAEVYFTAKHLITSVTRIVVDFEYADFNYARTLMTTQATGKTPNERLEWGASYVRDADNARAPIFDQELFDLYRDSLALIGDAEQALTSGVLVDSVYNDEQVRYALIDTLVAGQNYQVFKRSTNPESAVYRVSFTRFGQGEGDYRRVFKAAENATVFEWVAPDSMTGMPQGDYAPLRRWALPRQLQVADFRFNYKVSEKLRIFGEGAVSNEDRNRLSRQDDTDNTDLALRSGMKWQALQLADSFYVEGEAWYQRVGKRYENIDRVYQAEYNRIWDIRGEEPRADEQIVLGKNRFNWRNELFFELEQGLRSNGPESRSYRQVYTLESRKQHWIQGNFSLTQINTELDSAALSSRWTRNEGDIFWPIGKLRPGVVIWTENREAKRADTLSQNSFNFVDLKPYLRFSGKKLDWLLSYNRRRESEFLQGKIRDKAIGQSWAANVSWTPKAFNLQGNLAYRRFDVVDSLFEKLGVESVRALNTNLQGRWSPQKRWAMGSFLYEVSAEQTARQEVRFVEVNPGQGQYVWLDSLYNNDGIQQVNEFQIAQNPLLANYIRVIAPTEELIPTTRASLATSLRFDFKRLLKPEDLRRPLWRHVSLLSTLRVTQNRERNNNLSGYLVRLVDPFSDSTLRNANLAFRQELIFFQNSPKGDVRLYFQDNQSKLYLSSGDEFRAFETWGILPRFNLDQTKSITLETKLGTKSADVPSVADRNFFYHFFETEPTVNFQLERNLRLSASYRYRNRLAIDQPMGPVRVQSHRASLDGRLNFQRRNSLSARLEIVSLSQNGEANPTADFELKEALQPGLNGIWQIQATWMFVNNLEFTIVYDGRATAEQAVIHTGRVQVQAFF